MKRLHFITLLALAVVLTACEGFLDIKPYGKTIPKTSDEFASLLHARLNQIDYGENEPIIGNAVSVSDLEYYADNLDATLSKPEGSSVPIYIGKDLSDQQTRYQELYQRIRDFNIIIGNLPEGESDLDRNVLGTAYALRGICYYLLLRDFCEPYSRADQPGLPLIETFDMEEKPLRSSYLQTIAFIERDLNKALSFKVDDDIYRFTEDVVRAYLARFHFWVRNWDDAIEHSEYVLNAYPLLTGSAYTGMFTANAETGNRLIRSHIFSGQHDIANLDANTMLSRARPASKEFYDLFTEKERDIRFSLSLDNKRMNKKTAVASIRSDEMCLILAEAYAHKGDQEKALFYLNHLRSKRITGFEAYTLENLPAVDIRSKIVVDAEGKPLSRLLQAILNERRKELYAEGDRWYELKRNGRPEFWIGSNGLKYTVKQYMYTFPLPRVDVELTPGLMQNPGYTY